MKRRRFLQTTGWLTLPLTFSGLPLDAAAQSLFGRRLNEVNDRILVLIQLIGGNDGLNTLIPLDQYDRLVRARPNLLIPSGKTLSITDTLALHPAMRPIEKLWDNGLVSFVQGAGYVNQNRSHFRSADIWTSASPAEENWSTGWLGRYFERQYAGYPDQYPNADHPHPPAMTLDYMVSMTCQGLASNFSLAVNDPLSLTPPQPEDPNSQYEEELYYLRSILYQNEAYAEGILQAMENGNNLAPYPQNNALARSLRNVARLIAGGLQTKVYVVCLGGFDTHANQVDADDPTRGAHAYLLQQLSTAVAAFQTDLRLMRLDDRVLGMTFSEFGRQIRSNDSFGSDHGSAAPLLLFGKCVNSGILGQNPQIPEQVEPQEGVSMQHDFRDIYGSVLQDWFGLPPEEAQSVLGGSYQPLPILLNCHKEETRDLLGHFSTGKATRAFPNPFRNSLRIEFSSPNAAGSFSLLNGLGMEVLRIPSRHYPAGDHEHQFDTASLPLGNYYLRIQMGDRLESLPLVKI